MTAEQGELIEVEPPLEPLYRPEQVAEVLGCSRQHVVRKTRSGEWPGRRIARGYRYSKADVERIVELSGAGK